MRDDDNNPQTISVPEAGRRYFGLKSKEASYNAVKAGLIPAIRVGRLLRVPIRAMERFLDQVGRDSGQAAEPHLREPRCPPTRAAARGRRTPE